MMPARRAERTDITLQAIADFRAVFEQFDADGTSTIDSAEFAHILRLLGDAPPTPEELAALIRRAQEHDAPLVQPGETAPQPRPLTFKHFLHFFAIFKQDETTPVPHPALFRALDRERSGRITPEELQRSLATFGMNLSLDEVTAMNDVAVLSGRGGEIGPTDFRDLNNRIADLRAGASVSTDDDTSGM